MGTTSQKLQQLAETKAGIKSAINGSGNTVGDVFSIYPAAITTGKSEIASAITAKGVTTAATDTFTQMATNIGLIASGGESAVVTIHSVYGFVMTGSEQYGILSISPAGECQKAEILEGETIQLTVLKNSFLLPMVNADFTEDSLTSGDCEIIAEAEIFLEGPHYTSRLVFVYGDCEITV